MPTKKRSPADATLRNVRAAQKELAAVKRVLARLWTTLGKQAVILGNHEARIRPLELVRAKRR